MRNFVILALAFGLTAAACKKPAAKPAPAPASRVTGMLAYRNSCQGGPLAPFPGQAFNGGPELFLTDAQSYVKGGPVKPDALGRYSFAGVQPGTYQLRLAAGELHDFWAAAPTNGLQVIVPEAASHVNLGTTCADTMPPEALEIRAAWNDRDGSAARPDGILHLEGYAEEARLAVWADSEGSRHELAATWQVREGAVSLAQSTLTWAAGAVTRGTLAVLAGDRRGSFIRLSVPFRMHAQRAAGRRYGGWLAFADPATLAVFEGHTMGAVVMANQSGTRFASYVPEGEATASLTSLATFLAVTASVEAAFDLHQFATGSEIALELTNPLKWPVGVRLRQGETGGAFEITGEDGRTLAAAQVTFTTTALVQLRYDQSTGAVTAGFGEFAPAVTIAAVIPPAGVFSVVRLAPRLSVRRTNGAQAFDVACAGIFVDASALVYALPAAPQSLDGVVYDGLPGREGAGVFFWVDSGAFFGAGDVLVSVTEPRALSTHWFTMGATHGTLITDEAAEWVSQFVSIDQSDAESMAPMNDGAFMLY